MDKKCCIIGHSEINELDLSKIDEVLENLISNGFTEFYSGGMGNFDKICANKIFKLKDKYPFIKNYIVIPYLSFNIFNKEIFDDIIYPELEKYHFKSAIIYRNKWLIDNSNLALCYINYTWGGAYKTFTYCTKKQLEYINIGKFISN